MGAPDKPVTRYQDQRKTLTRTTKTPRGSDLERREGGRLAHSSAEEAFRKFADLAVWRDQVGNKPEILAANVFQRFFYFFSSFQCHFSPR